MKKFTPGQLKALRDAAESALSRGGFKGAGPTIDRAVLEAAKGKLEHEIDRQAKIKEGLKRFTAFERLGERLSAKEDA